MKKGIRCLRLLWTVLFLLSILAVTAEAAPTAAEITGEIERLTLNVPGDVYSGGVMIVGGSQVILPKNLLIDLPANRLSLQQIFKQAPAACVALGESGLSKADKCNASGTGGFATLSGVHSTNGNIIAGDVLIEKGKEIVFGVVSYISYSDGYFRLNGIPNDPATGVMVRLNDPTGKHTVQLGLGCAAGAPNCSPDPRFTLDPDNYTNGFSTGYPLCIPSTVSRTFASVAGLATSPAVSSASGSGDALCPSTNRTPGVIVEPPVNDSRLFAPILVGDSLTAKGNYEAINGVRFVSAHTTRVNRALETKNLATQPDYMFLSEVFVEAPSFQNQRARMLIIGFTTLAPTDVDFWTLHRDPLNNNIHQFPLASIKGCDVANGAGTCGNLGLAAGAGANIFRIRYDVDFLMAAANPAGGGTKDAKLSPCLQLKASTRFAVSSPGICAGGASLANNFGIMSPIPHEIQARTGHSLDNSGLITLDINGNSAANGQYLFPFGMNLGGIETADFLEVNINLLTTPRTFEGIPWNLDRRLSPSGCLDSAGVPGPCPLGALGSFALDPFPYTGLDPRLQAEFLVAGLPGGTPKGSYNDAVFTASALSNASNRVFSYVSGTPNTFGKFKFDGNSTVLPYVLGTFPADPPLIAINPTPLLSIFPPIADEDAAVTAVGSPVIIPVLANDFTVFGTIDPTSVKIATPPTSGSAVADFLTGTITYTPAPGAAVGTATFTYTVSNNFGSVSLPGTVTVTILVPPTAFNDTVSVPVNSATPINLVANDTAGSNIINLASLNIVSPAAPANCGTLFNQRNGTVLFTAPATTGTCSFSYVVSDVSLPSPLISTVATVTVTITPATAPPATLVANNDAATVSAFSAFNISVLANDTATTPAAINPASLAVSAATGGSAVANIDGTVTYTAPAALGTYSFTYTVQDNTLTPATSNTATVTVTVIAPLNPVAVADSTATTAVTPVVIPVLANDTSTGTINPATVFISTQSSNGVAVANTDGTITFTAVAGFSGVTSFKYTVSDNTTPTPLVSLPATVTVMVNAVNIPPVAVNDVASTFAGIPVIFSVIANDTDADGTINPASVNFGVLPLNVTATVSATGIVTFSASVAGTYAFTYTVSDNNGAISAPATVTVTVTSAITETVTVLRALYRAATGEWRVDGVVTNPTSTSVTLYIGRDLTGPALGSAPILVGGTWTFRLVGAPANPLPDATSTVSIQASPGGGSRLAFPLALR